MVKRSKEFEILAAKKLQIQTVIESVEKNQSNEFFMRGGQPARYSDLDSVMKTIKTAMRDIQTYLLIEQYVDVDYKAMLDKNCFIKNKNREIIKEYTASVPMVTVVTRITETASMQWEEFEVSAYPMEDTPQSIGSTETYLRRYSIMPAFGITPTDDDGNGGSSNNNNPSNMESRRRPLSRSSEPEIPVNNDGFTAPPLPDSQKNQEKIGQVEYDDIIATILKKKVSKEKWLLYIKAEFGIDSALSMTKDQYQKAMDVLTNNPAAIDPGPNF